MSIAQTFYFYDLETSGFSPREARIMQFAGQRTDLELKPVGEPHNQLIRMTDDVLPEPDAILITGITPQQTLSDGISEAEFLRIFYDEIAVPGTIFTGFNTVRFDDEFMRYLHYRNFYDPYEWQWRENRSRWDLLDLVRMMRALRPDGVKWPVDSKGQPTNRLELLTSLNKLDHASAHDALSDVQASLAVAKLLRGLQSKLFDYLLKMRDKKAVAKLVLNQQPFVYTSGKYPSEYEKTTVVSVLAENPERPGAVMVFDLRYDPEDFVDLSPEEMATAWRKRYDEPGQRLPVKTLQFNRCPAVAPLSVLDAASEKRIQLTAALAQSNFQKLRKIQDKFAPKLLKALEIINKQQQTRLLSDDSEVDAQLYEGFFEGSDKVKMSVVRAASQEELSSFMTNFHDNRLNALLPLYKARNYPKSLSDEDRAIWERFRERKLLGGGLESRMGKFFGRIGELDGKPGLTNEQQYVLQELQLYAQSIMPEQT